MPSRRETADPMVAQLIMDRLDVVLQEGAPRRAEPASRSRAEPASRSRAEPEHVRRIEIGPTGGRRVAPVTPTLPERGGGDLEDTLEQHVVPKDRGFRVMGPDPQDPVDETEARVLPSAARFGRLHLGVVAALVVVGLICTGWAVLRARPVALATPVPVTTAAARPATAGPAASTPSASSTQTEILVHVLGAVRRPGVVSLPDRARVRDAIEAAGGLRESADAGELNLAQVLQDGQQLLIGTKRHPAGSVRDGSGAVAGDASKAGQPSAGAPGAAVDLNAATETQLDALPGVGPVTAGNILAWRTEHGRFTRVEELQEVDGIGPKTYAQILPHVRV